MNLHILWWIPPAEGRPDYYHGEVDPGTFDALGEERLISILRDGLAEFRGINPEDITYTICNDALDCVAETERRFGHLRKGRDTP